MKIDVDTTNEQWQRYTYCRDHGHLQFLRKADVCDKFYAGDQWEKTDLDKLAAQGRPALTINKILSTMNTVFGEQIQNRTEVIFRPMSGSPAETAEALTKVWAQIAQNNQLPWVRTGVFQDGMIRSRGFFDARIQFNDSMMGEVVITQKNSKNIVLDPDGEEYDPDTWNDLFETKWLTTDDIDMLYGKDAAEYLKVTSTDSNSQGYDSADAVRDRFSQEVIAAMSYVSPNLRDLMRNIRVLERQYKMLSKQEHFVDVNTGDMRPIPQNWDRNRIALLLEKAGGAVAVTKKLVKRIRWRVTAGNLVLHDDWSPYKHYTIVPFFPYFRHGRTIGAVENLLGPQELLNKSTSQELHIINTSANSGWKVRKGALQNMSLDELMSRGAQTGLVVELDDLGHLEKIQPNQIPSGVERISYKAEEHLKGISGVSDSMQGFDRADVAAKAIAYKQQRGAVNFTSVMDNLQRTDWLLARNVLDMVQNFYTEERIINITHNDLTKDPETMVVNQYDSATQTIVNDLTIGEYDIIIMSAPQRDSLEDSQFEQARAMREIGVPIPDKVLIENSRLMRRNDIIKEMDAQANGPQAQMENELIMRGKQAEVTMAEAKAEKTMADTRLSVARTDKLIQEGAVDQQEESPAQKAEREYELKMTELDKEFILRQEASEREHQLARERLREEMQLKREAQEFELDLKQKEADARLLQERVAAARAEEAAET